jgi:hypothetical protein
VNDPITIVPTDEMLDYLRLFKPNPASLSVGHSILAALADALPAPPPGIVPWNWYRDEVRNRVLVHDIYGHQVLATTINPGGRSVTDLHLLDDMGDWELIGPCEVPS